MVTVFRTLFLRREPKAPSVLQRAHAAERPLPAPLVVPDDMGVDLCLQLPKRSL